MDEIILRVFESGGRWASRLWIPGVYYSSASCGTRHEALSAVAKEFAEAVARMTPPSPAAQASEAIPSDVKTTRGGLVIE